MTPLVTVVDLVPEHDRRPVVVVVDPGLLPGAMAPLEERLRVEGFDVHALSFGCGAGDLASWRGAVREAVSAFPEPPVVVAHGVGALVVLDPGVGARSFVLLGPVLGLEPVGVTAWLAERPVDGGVVLDPQARWGGRPVADVLLGAALPLGCVAPGFARDVQAIARGGEVPLELAAISAPVRIAVSLGDDVAPVEIVVPSSRALPDRRLSRLGLGRLQERDYAHGDLLVEPGPLAWAARATRRAW